MAEKEVHVDEVKAFKTQSGNTRFVLRADDGTEYTTFKEPIAKQALAAEGKRARIGFHEQERNGFTNVYLDRVERRRRAACRPTRRSRSCSRSKSAWPRTSAKTVSRRRASAA
jgi:hypothetical protein